jgi:hypothetical protein
VIQANSTKTFCSGLSGIDVDLMWPFWLRRSGSLFAKAMGLQLI